MTRGGVGVERVEKGQGRIVEDLDGTVTGGEKQFAAGPGENSLVGLDGLRGC